MEITSDPIVQQAIRAVLDLDLDAFERDCIFETALYPEHAQSPWIWCWRAMAQRIRYGDYTAAFHHAQRASELFALHNDQDGYARSVAEAAIACYHLGQYVAGLHLLTACPAPAQPSIASALALARYLNAIGLNDLAAALNAAEQGLRALAHEPETQRRVRWQIVLKRNLVPAYHYCGQLPMARQLADEALQLAEVHQIDDYHYHWILYERGLLEQRAGNLAHALQLLQQARTHCEHAAERNGTVSPLWRWIVAAEGHTLRDQGDLSAADACYQRSGWGEGEDGPLMLWLLQERWNEARCAAEARLTAAYALPCDV